MSDLTTQWEYGMFAIAGNFVDGLNQLGEKRWEAVAVFREGKEGITVIFKRPKSALVVPPIGSSLNTQ